MIIVDMENSCYDDIRLKDGREGDIRSIREKGERRRRIEDKSTCSRSGGKYNCFCDDSSGERKIPCHFQADPCKEGIKGRTGGVCREDRPGQVQDGNDGR